MKKQLALGAVGAILIALAAFFLGLRMNFHPENQKPGKFPEQLVYVRSADDVVDGGVLFTSTGSPSKPLAIIWVHGWGRISTPRATLESGGHWRSEGFQPSRSIRACTTS